MPWSVEFHSACGEWAGGLEQGDAESLLAAVPILSDAEPALGRPLVDTVAASRHPSTKELRPGSTWRADIRVLFAFDKTRRAVLLVGGDKATTGEAGTDATSRSGPPVRGTSGGIG
jgi:hypothetical protein